MRAIGWAVVWVAACGGPDTFTSRGVPRLDGAPTLSVEPSVVGPDGVLRARAGAVMTLALPVSAIEGLDLASSSVTLTGVELAWNGEAWERTLDGSEGDGAKALDARIADQLGQVTRIQSEDLDTPVTVTFDFTPPTASCAVSPPVARGGQPLVFSLAPSEPLAGPPVIPPEMNAVTFGAPTLVDGGWVADIAPVEGADLDVVVRGVQVADLAGNTAEGDALCPEAERTAVIRGVAPVVLAEDVSLDVSPAIEVGGVPRARAGAVVTLVLPPQAPIDPARSFVSMSGLVLSSTDGETWTGVLDPAVGDGRKSLFATLVDSVGNTLLIDDPGVAFDADFTPPVVVDASVSRAPFLDSAVRTTGVVEVSDVDPVTGAPVAVTVRVTLSEDPVGEVVLTPSVSWAAEDVSESDPRRRTWILGPPADVAEGEVRFSVVTEDAAGNRSAPQDLGFVARVDRSGPTATVAVDDRDRVVLIREPWGTVADPRRRIRVEGRAGAAPAGANVRVSDAFATPIAIVRAGADGAIPPVALFADDGDVFVEVLDDAGNPGPTRRVRDVRLLASPAGGPLRSPHRVEAAPAGAQTWAPSGRSVVALDGGPVVTSPGWSYTTLDRSAVWPEGRAGASMAWDPVRREVVLYGGFGAGGYLGDTWTWDGQAWTLAAGDGIGPAARRDAAMAWDAARQALVLYGGVLQEGITNEMWWWDGAVWTPAPADPGRPGFFSALAATDPLRREVVFIADNEPLVVVWDGSTARMVGPPDMPFLNPGAAAWDPSREQVVVFGLGLQPTMHAWTGSGFEVIDSGTGPGPRARARLVDDGEFGLLLFGGQDTLTGELATDTWRWADGAWTRAPEADAPWSARTQFQAAWDGAYGHPIVFSGDDVDDISGSVDYPNDLWRLRASGWVDTPPDNSLGTQIISSPSAATDPLRNRVVVASGFDGAAARIQPVVFDGVVWRNMTGFLPSARAFSTFAYDPSADRFLLHGGQDASGEILSDTWVLDGDEWRLLSSAADALGPRAAAAAAFDPVSDRMLLFGGFGEEMVEGTTWAFDGADWVDVTPRGPSPSARLFHAMASDPLGGGVFLHGGTQDQVMGLEDTWWWDGTQWSEITPPGSRIDWRHGMLSDPWSDRVLVAGFGAYSWSGDTWASLPLADGALLSSPRALVPGLYGGPPLVVGGTARTSRWGVDVTRWDHGSGHRPAHLASFDLTAGALGDGLIEAVTLRWVAGGIGRPGGVAQTGVRLALWDGLAWVEGPSGTGSGTAPSPLCWMVRASVDISEEVGCTVTTDPGLLSRLPGGLAAERVRARVETRAISGVGTVDHGELNPDEAPGGAIRTDDVTLTVRYRLPAD